jgi:hypothetical protein
MLYQLQKLFQVKLNNDEHKLHIIDKKKDENIQ